MNKEEFILASPDCASVVHGISCFGCRSSRHIEWRYVERRASWIPSPPHLFQSSSSSRSTLPCPTTSCSSARKLSLRHVESASSSLPPSPSSPTCSPNCFPPCSFPAASSPCSSQSSASPPQCPGVGPSIGKRGGGPMGRSAPRKAFGLSPQSEGR